MAKEGEGGSRHHTQSLNLTRSNAEDICSHPTAPSAKLRSRAKPPLSLRNLTTTLRPHTAPRCALPSAIVVVAMDQRELESRVKALTKSVAANEPPENAIKLLESLKKDAKPTEEMLRVRFQRFLALRVETVDDAHVVG